MRQGHAEQILDVHNHGLFLSYINLFRVDRDVGTRCLNTRSCHHISGAFTYIKFSRDVRLVRCLVFVQSRNVQ